MAKINTTNYQPVTSWNGTQDLLIVEQPDGTKVATPEQVKQYVETGDFEATGEVKDGHGNILKDMAKSTDVDTELNKKLTLVEHKKTTTGDSVTLDTQLERDVEYLLSMGSPVTATGRRMRLSIISLVGGNLNEAGFGNSDAFTITVSDRLVTITASSSRYGVEASLIKLS